MIVEVHRIQTGYSNRENVITFEHGTCFGETSKRGRGVTVTIIAVTPDAATILRDEFNSETGRFTMDSDEFTPVSDDLADAIHAYVALADSHIIPDDFRFEGAL
jgi:hypothetical protein